MSGRSIIGSLYVALGLDSANFDAGAKKAQGSLAGLQGSIKAFAAGALGALSFGGVVAVMQSAVDRMDDLNKASQRIGIPIDQLSGLEYAAKLADVSIEGLQTSMKKLSVGLADFAAGGKSDASSALKAMGINALDTNGKLRPTSDILMDIADKFASYKDGAGKAALAVALFGRAGLDMIPMLNEGAAGLREMQDQARAFGIVVDKEAGQAAEDFNDNITRLTEAGRGMVQQIVSNLLPALVDITNQFVQAAESGGDFTEASEGIKAVLIQISAFAMQTAHEFRALGTLFSVMSENATKGDGFSAAMGRWKQAFADIQTDTEKTTAAISKLYNVGADPTGALASIDKLASSMKSVSQEAAGGKSDPPIVQTLTKAKTKTDEATKALQKLKDEGKDVYESTRTPLENYQLGVSRLNELLKSGVITHDTYNRAVSQLRDEFNNTGTAVESVSVKIGETLTGELQSWIDSAIDGTFDLQDSLNNLLGTLTKMAVNGVFQSLMGGGGHALYGGGGLGGIFGSLLGFAKGGTILPGGTGGIDSQLVMFRKSPNERVDITKEGQTLVGGSSRVVINDYRTNAPKVETQQNGPDFTVVIRDQVNQSINQGYTDGSMSGRYGARPAATRR